MITLETTLAEIVLERPGVALLLSRYGLDFCCNGGRSLGVAAREAGLDGARVLAELERADDGAPREDPRARTTPSLVAHLIGAYHEPLRQTLPVLVQLAAKVARVHGARESHLLDVHAILEPMARALLEHLDYEETELFPLLMGKHADPARVEAELRGMVSEHDEVSASLRRLRALGCDFRPPAEACASYRSLYEGLAELEHELFCHVHLENHVLLPRFLPSASAGARPQGA